MSSFNNDRAAAHHIDELESRTTRSDRIREYADRHPDKVMTEIATDLDEDDDSVNDDSSPDKGEENNKDAHRSDG